MEIVLNCETPIKSLIIKIMGDRYSEDKFIEQPCMDIFSGQLSWRYANVFQGETFGEEGTIGRDSEADIILRVPFYKAVKSLNPKLPLKAYNEAYDYLISSDSTKDLAENNQDKYFNLKDGIPVSFKNHKGEIVKNKKLRIFNYDNIDDNDFLAVQQLWIEGKSKRKKRPDVVGFVNGIPLVFIELKAHHKKLRVAYEKNLTDYKDTIPKIFHCNAFIILSNGLESRVGSITSKFEHFHEWKRIQEDEEGIVSLDTIIRGTCEKNRLMDLFQNFIAFDSSIGSVVKLVARNHQYIGVNRAIEHFTKRRQALESKKIELEEARKLGVFWHTQGSGKSYSMVFLCQKIMREYGGGYTFLLVTDRTELDKQIYGTFDGVGAIQNPQCRAKSGDHLKELLQTDQKYIFTLVHKFNFEEVISERDNIIILSDEAHRTQGGTLAMNMRRALPNASLIGFTGTPLFKDDELTKKLFGDYVSTYNFKRSIEDKATVPLYYENRGEKLKLDNPIINDQIKNAIESFELDVNQEEKLKQMFKREYPILTAEKRLKSIAEDIVEHFNRRGYKGKAMLVVLDKVTAVRMYNYITEAWKKYLLAEKREIEKIKEQQEHLSRMRDYKWSEETEVSVIVSHEQNEIKKFTAWGLDIEPHRLKLNTRDLETEFKDEDNPFRFAIVCAMWITGFDVPSLSTLYLDKPLKSHTLMQAIARANRVHEGKNNGLIVDYIETYKALLQALAIYGESGGAKKPDGEDEPPVRPLEDLVAELEEALLATELFLSENCNVDIRQMLNEDNTLKLLKKLQEAHNAICQNDESRNKFGILGREVFKKYKALMPNKEVYEYEDRRDLIDALYRMIAKEVEEADITSLVKQVQDIVSKSIETLDIELDKVEGYGKKVDISGLNFKKIEEEFLKVEGSKNVAVQSLKERVEKKLNRMLEENPLRIDYYERYQEIIEEYNSGKDYKAVKEIFDQLVVLFADLSEEDKRAEREDLQVDELTVFDMLEKGKKITDKEKAKLKEAAQKLLYRLKTKELKVANWVAKEQTRAAVKKAIEDYLFQNLPYPTYTEGDISVKSQLLFDHFKNSFADYPSTKIYPLNNELSIAAEK
jgi:type I restriction enzyme R subunit